MLMVFCCIASAAISQTEKGRLTLGNALVSGGVSKNISESGSPGYPTSRTEYRTVSLSINPNVGKFIMDNLLVGVGLQASFNNGKLLKETSTVRQSNTHQSDYAIGPFAQYFFTENTSGKPFIQLYTRIGIGKANSEVAFINASKMESTTTNTSFGSTVNAGYAIFLNRSFMISFFGGYSYTQYKNDNSSADSSGSYGSNGTNTNSGFSFGVSINTSFSKKQD